uniref:Proteasome assembly chaperone 3 n=1 Tax=Falco tinnunculus TaxID=100819 RepID=A0A8C4XL85_FALTI
MEARPIVTSKQREEVVHGVPTEVVCTAFSNSVLVVVTQYGKMGTIVYVDPNTVGDNVGRPSLTTKVLLGKDELPLMEFLFFSSGLPFLDRRCFAFPGVIPAKADHIHPQASFVFYLEMGSAFVYFVT